MTLRTLGSTLRLSLLSLVLTGTACSDLLNLERGVPIDDGGAGGDSSGLGDAEPRGDASLDGDASRDISPDAGPNRGDTDALPPDVRPDAVPDVRPDGIVVPDTGPIRPDGGPVTPDSGPTVPDSGPVIPDSGPLPDGGPKCNPTTCPTGCCDATDICVIAPNAAACGSGGARCSVCATGQECSQGACKCGASCTSGCCTATGACVTPTDNACGLPGEACNACGAGKKCDVASGQCVCNAASCPTGCCDATGTCVQYGAQKQGQCGTGGAVCTACATGQACGATGTCECTTASCSTGCCQGNSCIASGQQNANTCGAGGNACGACATGQACTGGACSCGGTSCAGCCANGACQTSNDDHCGVGGGVCAVCQATQDCNAQGKCACTASSCPNGCCDANGVCQTGTTAGVCGTGGAACKTCGTGQTCGGGQCVCNSTSCGAGCCDGTTCVPYASQKATACGAGGAVCAGCPSGTMCNAAGQCICNATSCPTGCCSGNSCVAYGSQSNTTCGVGGAACAECATGRTCAKSSVGCATWCGLRTAPAGVAAADYQCLDFDLGMPSASVWAPNVVAPSRLELTTTSVSIPNALFSAYDSGNGGGNAVMVWRAPTSTAPVKNVSISAALNIILPMRGVWGGYADIMCVEHPGNWATKVCLSNARSHETQWGDLNYTGLFIRSESFATMSGVHVECPVNFATVSEAWFDAKIEFNPTTGLARATVGGTAYNCQTDPLAPTTVAAAHVGAASMFGISDMGFNTKFDNVVVAVQR